MIEIIEAGNLLSIQDLGREGYQKFGVPVGGVMDKYSAILSNYLVGNKENTPLLEFLFGNVKIKFLSTVSFAVGANAEVFLNEDSILPWKVYIAKKNDILKISRLKNGVYGYISFSGGLACKKIFGSCSTYPRAGWGRYLRRGDMIKLQNPTIYTPPIREIPKELIPIYSPNPIVRVIIGPHEDHFTKEGIETFLSSAYRVTEKSDRMGYRLDGPTIQHSNKGADILSNAIPLGAIQVPPDGKPIVMLADHQTTGGYATLGVVISADISNVAQTPIGDALRFKKIKVEEAHQLWRKYNNILTNIKNLLEKKVKGLKIKVNNKKFLVFLEEL